MYMASSDDRAIGTSITNNKNNIRLFISHRYLFALFSPHPIWQALVRISEVPLSPACRLRLREEVVRTEGRHCLDLLPGFVVGMAVALAAGMQAVADTEA